MPFAFRSAKPTIDPGNPAKNIFLNLFLHALHFLLNFMKTSTYMNGNFI